jgi:thiol-disulfide isomerase/thioredoxin
MFTRRLLVGTAALLFAGSGLAIAQTETKPAAPAAKQPAKPGKSDTSTKPDKGKKQLKVGDAAPSLSVEKWVKGEPVTGFEKGRVYVVEFWATWCGPCIASMPHMTELQAQYKDQVTVISVTSADPKNTLDKVEAMVKDKGDEGMGYTVAWDKGRETNDAYMKAAGQNGIPCAFIVDAESKVAWIGHPRRMDEKLAEVVRGAGKVKKEPPADKKPDAGKDGKGKK